MPPIDLKWTNKNVEALRVFFGNEEPHIETFNKIIPKLEKKLNYWKQFRLTQIGKARVIEIFLASKLIYATRFYPIPSNMLKVIQKATFNYINFTNKIVTIAQSEMWKIKAEGCI